MTRLTGRTGRTGPPDATGTPDAAPLTRHSDTGAPPRIDWRSAALAGVTAGAIFIVGEMLLVWLVGGGSPWGPPRMIAAIAMGRDVLPPPGDFAPVPVTVAMVVHFALSVLYGLATGWPVNRLGTGAALAVGLVVGLVLCGVNFHLVAPAPFPWFVGAQNRISVLMHAVFGVAAAGACVAMRSSQRP